VELLVLIFCLAEPPLTSLFQRTWTPYCDFACWCWEHQLLQ
jgi:hypothetical protein